MSAAPVAVTVARRYDAPPAAVFDAWLDAEGLGQWLFATPDGEGTWFELTHDGVWADYEERTRQGWTMILDGLARTLAG